MKSETFAAKTLNGKPINVEVFYDDQPGVEPGWCYRAFDEDGICCGADILEDVDCLEEAVYDAKSWWGVDF